MGFHLLIFSTHLINQTTQQLRQEAGGLVLPQIELPLLAGWIRR